MLPTIIIALLALLVIVETIHEDNDWSVLCMIPISVLFIVIVQLFISFLANPHSYVQVDRSNLVALKDGTSVSGSFFLGTGNISSKATYYYYKESSPNHYEYRSIDNSTIKNITVVTDEDKQPYILTKTEVTPPSYDLWHFIPFESTSTDYLEFHIPKGSIISNYKLGG